MTWTHPSQVTLGLQERRMAQPAIAAWVRTVCEDWPCKYRSGSAYLWSIQVSNYNINKFFMIGTHPSVHRGSEHFEEISCGFSYPWKSLLQEISIEWEWRKLSSFEVSELFSAHMRPTVFFEVASPGRKYAVCITFLFCRLLRRQLVYVCCFTTSNAGYWWTDWMIGFTLLLVNFAEIILIEST